MVTKEQRNDWLLKEFNESMDRIIRLLRLSLSNKETLEGDISEELYELIEKVYQKGLEEGRSATWN